MNVNTITAKQILAISENSPEELFGKSSLVYENYKILAKIWHPDRVTGDKEVFSHINMLHDKAKKIVEDGKWHIPGEFSFTSNGKEYVLRYFKTIDFELGTVFLSDTRITYVIEKSFADLAENAKNIISGLKYPDNKTEDVMSKYLPSIKGYYETSDSVIIMMDKPSDLIRMKDLVEYYKGSVDPRHVAWMISRMLNLASYLEWAKICHGDFSLDTLFISPEFHSVCIIGGWWYSSAIGTKPLALPSRTINNAPSEFMKDKLSVLGIDPELIKLTSRELLGNANGILLKNNNDIPKSLVNWLRISGKGSAVDDYTQWREKIVIDSFGKRAFRVMPISAKDVYKNENMIPETNTK